MPDKRLNAGLKGKHSKNERDKLNKRLGEQEEMVVARAEEITKDEVLNLENLLGFINQRKLHSYLNISNIMRLNKLDFTDLYYTRDLDLMLVRKTLLEKVNFEKSKFLSKSKQICLMTNIDDVGHYLLFLNGNRTAIPKTTKY